jgi:hypothetical protein
MLWIGRARVCGDSGESPSKIASSSMSRQACARPLNRRSSVQRKSFAPDCPSKCFLTVSFLNSWSYFFILSFYREFFLLKN